ncbi:hypothetical protein GIB67_023120 [Kingdonia uniflora]|uniref:Band 7 domain-containing protein n=1 Tax=Kingdonia uniflora TaxID=39325 RepID=A0A7J7M5M3_9MAGN|nr:hypothetical protein GIB67_023120 [Kingdonia uniflora]
MSLEFKNVILEMVGHVWSDIRGLHFDIVELDRRHATDRSLDVGVLLHLIESLLVIKVNRCSSDGSELEQAGLASFGVLATCCTSFGVHLRDARQCVPKLILDDIFEQKSEIAKAVKDVLEKALSAYGYEIVQTVIVDIEPDSHVKHAIIEINAGCDGHGARDTVYFDTMKEISAASKSSTVFIISHGPGVVRDVAAQIRGLLQESAHLH